MFYYNLLFFNGRFFHNITCDYGICKSYHSYLLPSLSKKYADNHPIIAPKVSPIILTKAIRKVAHKNIEQISVWTEKHPEYMDYNSKYNERYMKLIGEAMPGATYEESDKNYKKIARNITKKSIIEK